MSTLAVWPRYGPLGASSRLRLSAYEPYLQAAGFTVSQNVLLDDAYVAGLYKGHRAGSFRLVRAYAARIAALLGGFNTDVLWLEKEALPWLPMLEEVAFARRRRWRLVLDLDDSWMLRYEAAPSRSTRALLGRKFRALAQHADLVTAGNRHLREWAEAVGARETLFAPTVVELARYGARVPRRQGPPRIVWIGTPLNTKYLLPVQGALEAAGRMFGAELVLIGADDSFAPDMPVRRLAWREASEAADIAACDIGIMPLPDTPFERGKSGYKLIQYMACGLPVIASPVGENTWIVTPETGLLAASAVEWEGALAGLLANPAQCAVLGEAGRARVAQHYALEVWGPRLAARIKALAAEPRPI